MSKFLLIIAMINGFMAGWTFFDNPGEAAILFLFGAFFLVESMKHHVLSERTYPKDVYAEQENIDTRNALKTLGKEPSEEAKKFYNEMNEKIGGKPE